VKVKILRAASADLKEGYRFYEEQSSGVGAYFRLIRFERTPFTLLL